MIKKYQLLIVCVILTIGVAINPDRTSAQSRTTKTFYFRNKKGLVSTKDSADYIRVISPIDTATGELYAVTDYYRNGRVMTMGKSLNNDIYLKRQGIFTSYFENGVRKSEINYDKGKPVGDELFYYPNGNLYYKSRLDSSGYWVTSEVRDSTGRELVKNGNGKAVFYNEDFKKVASVGPIVNGLHDGEWEASNDTMRWVCLYVKGKGTSGKSFDLKGNVHEFQQAATEPKFDGGVDAFNGFLVKHIRYPKIAKKNDVQGKVFLSFIIERDGRVVDIKVIRGIGSGCDEEAVRVLKLMPNWTPGYQFGVPVRVQYSLPISFSLKN